LKHTLRFLSQKKVLTALSILLIMSIGLNVYLFFEVTKPLQGGKSGEESSWIRGFGHAMWDEFKIKLTPNKAVFSYPADRQLNVSVRALYWAPFESGSRPFSFQISEEEIIGHAITTDEEPRVIGEKTIIANKSKDEMDYEILFNFTVTFHVGGIYLYRVGGDGCIATFAINVWK